MSQGTLTIYNASAGSGKTYTLTGIYLSSLFRSNYSYRKILAVTFTNKATAEMKSRILDNLNKLASGAESDYLPELIKETKQTEEWVRRKAAEILNLILHDFSRFSVSTIDSFFQKILRAFARESGLHSGYNIDLDNEIWLNAAIDAMISSASGDKQLRDWLISYALANIDSEKSWNLKAGIMRLARELFNEKFRLLSRKEIHKLGDKQFLEGYVKKLRSIVSDFEKRQKECGTRAMEIVNRFGLSDDMFYRKSGGVPKYINQLVSGAICEPNCYVREILNDPPRWSTGKMDNALSAAINAGLGEILQTAIAHYDSDIIVYRTAAVIVKNIYALGILTDIMENIRKLTTSENTFLLSDAGEFLSSITEGDQCPFIYEKVGNAYENFMIDEFQDTSLIQWNNFAPLITNSKAQGYDNLVVGDIKQSIYRWRNSDWRILRSLVAETGDDHSIVTKSLSVNWRSRANIISFNNRLFSILPSLLDVKLENDVIPDRFDSIYSEADQKDPAKKPGGYVKISFVANPEEGKWEESVLEMLPSLIESLQDKGYRASDIGIIVRDGRHGAMVLNKLIDHSNQLAPGNRYNFKAVSNDSLLLSGSPVINFIISALKYVKDDNDMISARAMEQYFEAEEMPEYREFLTTLRQKPLFEVIEQIISRFRLGEKSWNAAWLSTFQDNVLGFISNGNPDLKSFLEWWETSGQKRSVTLPGNQDAMRILTIHKSKGLEFSVVILPFISWDLDHPPLMQPLLWVKPQVEPFSDLGIVPVKSSKELANTIFSKEFYDEKYSIYLDNLNLLYVATTRAKDVLYGFAPASPKSGNVAGLLREAFSPTTGDDLLNRYFTLESNVFEFGELPECKREHKKSDHLIIEKYPVTYPARSLKLKLHGENYFSAEETEIRKRINYGKLMHEVFEGIDVAADIPGSIRKLVLEGKLPAEEAPAVITKVENLISHPPVSEWFSEGNIVIKETGILLSSGNIKRPDRVILKGDKTIIVDFKFGSESTAHHEQVEIYRGLLLDMGYKNIEAFIWYVDNNKVVAV